MTRLTLHAISVLSSNGKEQTEHLVRCPHQRRTIALRECEVCESESQGLMAAFDRGARQVGMRLGREPLPTPGQLPTRVSELMTSAVICVMPEVRLDELVALFVERGFSGAPVVSAEGETLGMVTATDLLRVRYEVNEGEREPGAGSVTAGELMTSPVTSISIDASIQAAAAVMVERRIHHLPVVDERGRLLGILSALDLAGATLAVEGRNLLK